MVNSPLVQHVLETIKPEIYYKVKLPTWDGHPNTNVSCPFPEKHKQGTDNKPSFSVNVNGTGGCYCHACGTKVASIIHFEKLLRNDDSTDDAIASFLYSEYIHKVLESPELVDEYLQSFQENLNGAPEIRKKILKEIQIGQSTVDKFQLGWDTKSRRVTIPILDKFNQLLNIRLYRLPSMRDDDKFPKILNTKDYGKNSSIYPAPSITAICASKHKPKLIYWFTGERDTILAWDKGIPSFCYTAGENVCKKEWMVEIKLLDAKIAVVQDNDEAGIKGATKRIEMLRNNGISCILIEIPDVEGKDFSDCVANGYKVKDFLELGQTEKDAKSEHETEESEIHPIPRVFDPTLEAPIGVYSVFEIGRNPALLNRPIKVKAIVSGKIDRTYSIPHIFKVGEIKYRIPISREILQLVREHDVNIIKFICHLLSTKAKIIPLDKITVTEVEIIPIVQPGNDSPYVNQRCYYFGSVIECNKPYEMDIIPTTDMSTQETIGLITEIVPISNVLDSYEFTPASCAKLIEEFQPKDDDNQLEHLYELVKVISQKFTRIYNRDDLHLVALLTWVSPLQFEFPFEGVQRGWFNTLVLGDTETGKSKICQALTSLFRCGAFINAESCSYVGLVGGAVKSTSGMNLLRWGKIPLYNRQLVVVEELSGLTTEQISYMSEVRSAGVARYDKAGLTGETSAKTRLICLSNVRDKGKSLADYNTGVQAALQLVGQNEDLARFDLLLTATDDEVDSAIINKDRSEETENTFSFIELSAFQDLVMFAWSLKPQQIEFTIGAYRECLTKTLQLSKKYHPSIPIFKAGSGRLKLARVALAIACLQMSWDAIKEKLLVEAIHVETAAKLLEHLYSKPSFGYARYSKIQFDLQKVLNEPETIIKIKEIFTVRVQDFYAYISHSLSFTKFEVADAMGVHHMFVERVISQMFLSNLIRKGDRQTEWTLSRAGRKWVERQILMKNIK